MEQVVILIKRGNLVAATLRPVDLSPGRRMVPGWVPDGGRWEVAPPRSGPRFCSSVPEAPPSLLSPCFSSLRQAPPRPRGPFWWPPTLEQYLSRKTTRRKAWITPAEEDLFHLDSHLPGAADQVSWPPGQPADHTQADSRVLGKTLHTHFSHILFSTRKKSLQITIVRIWGRRKDLALIYMAQPYPAGPELFT